MEDLQSNKLLPTGNIKPMIHDNFPRQDRKTYVDFSIQDVKPVQIMPENTDLNGISSLEFIIHETSEHFIDLNSIELELKLKLLDDGGARAGVDGAANVYFINNLIQTIFPIRKTYINDVPISFNYNSSYVSHLRQLLDTEESMVKNKGVPLGAFTNSSTTLGDQMTDAYMGRVEDRKRFSKQEVIHLKGPLDLEISSVNQWLIDRCNVKIGLELASKQFVINTTAGLSFNYKLSFARLHVKYVKPMDSGFLSTAKSLMSGGSMEYLMRNYVTHTEQFAAGQNTISISRPFQQKIPSRLYLMMVRQDALNGVFERNPLYFQHNNLINYRVSIDGISIVDQDVNIDNGAVNVYHDSQIAHGNNSHFIPYETYTKGAFVICINTNFQNGDELTYERRGNLQIHLRLGGNLATNNILFVMGEVFTTFSIDADRSVTTNFAY